MPSAAAERKMAPTLVESTIPSSTAHPPGGGEQVFSLWQSGAGHAAENATGEGVAGEGGKHLPGRGVDRNVAAGCEQRRALAGEVLFLHQQGLRSDAGFQRPVDDLGALGDEYAQRGLQPMAQLRLGEVGVGKELRPRRDCRCE